MSANLLAEHRRRQRQRNRPKTYIETDAKSGAQKVLPHFMKPTIASKLDDNTESREHDTIKRSFAGRGHVCLRDNVPAKIETDAINVYRAYRMERNRLQEVTPRLKEESKSLIDREYKHAPMNQIDPMEQKRQKRLEHENKMKAISAQVWKGVGGGQRQKFESLLIQTGKSPRTDGFPYLGGDFTGGGELSAHILFCFFDVLITIS